MKYFLIILALSLAACFEPMRPIEDIDPPYVCDYEHYWADCDADIIVEVWYPSGIEYMIGDISDIPDCWEEIPCDEMLLRMN